MQIDSDDPNKIRLPLAIRVILSLSLVLAAFLISLSLQNTVSWLVLLGMSFSFLGDLFNAGVIPLPVPLTGGMIAFSAAHICYISAFCFLLEPADSLNHVFFWPILAAIWLVTAIFWRLFIFNPKRIPFLNTGSLLYALLIGAMVTFTCIVGLRLGDWWWSTFFGALLFYISDTIIGITDIGKVSMKRPYLWIWLTYVLGQMGIIYGVWLGFIM